MTTAWNVPTSTIDITLAKETLRGAARKYLQVLENSNSGAWAIIDAHNDFCELMQLPTVANMIHEGGQIYTDNKTLLISTPNPYILVSNIKRKVLIFATM
jgi:hypothetical protein